MTLRLPALIGLILPLAVAQSHAQSKPPKRFYDVAAYYWPAYHPEPRQKRFFSGNEGEWEIIRASKPKFEGHNQPRVPLWGYYNEADPRVVEQKIAAARKYGVDAFIVDWYWYENAPYLEDFLNKGLLKAKNVSDIKFYLMWANHDATTAWNYNESHERKVVWPGAVDRAMFDTLVARWIAYFKHPSYYKLDGKPVFSLYRLGTLVEGLGGIKNTKAALDYFRSEVKKAGFPDLHFQLVLWKKLPIETSAISGDEASTESELVNYLGVNSLTNYQFIHLKEAGRDYQEWGNAAVRQWSAFDSTYSVPFFAHVAVDWDTNPRFKDMKPVISNATPAGFKTFLQQAKAYMDRHPDQPPLVTINSWNEWSEGSYLEPDTRWKYGYLEAVRDVFGTNEQAKRP